MIGPPVVLDALGLGLHVFIQAFALLPERRRAAGRHAVLETFAVLPNLDALGADSQRALREDYPALEYRGALGVIGVHAVGLDVDRLVAVGKLGERSRGGERRRQRHQPCAICAPAQSCLSRGRTRQMCLSAG